MHEYYLDAAQRISNLADEYSGDYGLATILMVGSARITKLAKEQTGLILKTSSLDKMEKKSVSNQHT